MKTIVYIGGFEMPDKNAAANRVRNIGNIYASLGYKVIFIGTNKVLQDNYPIYLNDKLSYYEVKYPSGTTEWIKYLSDITAYTEIIERHDKDIVAVFCYDLQAIVLKKLQNYCKKKSMKLVSDCTEWTNTQGNVLKRVIKFFDTEYRMRSLNFKCDGIIAISKLLADYYHKKVTVQVPVLVDLAEFRNIKNEKKKDGKIHFVYAGFTGKSKDRLDYIIAAFGELYRSGYKNFMFDIAGTDVSMFLQAYPRYEELIDGIGEFVTFHGRLSHEKTLELLKSSDFSLFIRNDNKKCNAGFPTKFAESISCGIPVITNMSSNLSDYLIDGVNGYSVTNRKNELVIYLKRIMDDYMKMYPIIQNNCRNCDLFGYESYISVFQNFNTKIGI